MNERKKLAKAASHPPAEDLRMSNTEPVAPLATLKDLSPVSEEAIRDFVKEMTEETIPEIIKVVEARQTLAAESRRQQLKC
jgi:ABC-type phosphate/phosphonate transport system substrate-binding protein